MTGGLVDGMMLCRAAYVSQSLLERMSARGTLVILSPGSRIWSEIDCVGSLSGVMDNAKKYFSAGDLEPDQDKGSDMHKKCDKRYRRKSLERTHLALLCTV